MVEAIDKKHNFPVPSVRQRKSVPAEASASSSTATGADTGNSIGKAVAKVVGAEKQKIITLELRQLLSRKIVTLDKKELEEHGGGVS